MLRIKTCRENQRGATLVEFSIGITVFLTAMFGVLEFGRALWAHNALTDAARRGARYAALHTQASEAQVKNVVIYGNEEGTGRAMLPNLSATNVEVDYDNFQLNDGTVTVSINEYQFQLIIPLVGTTITMPHYSTTLTAECAGLIPANVP